MKDYKKLYEYEKEKVELLVSQMRDKINEIHKLKTAKPIIETAPTVHEKVRKIMIGR